MSQDENIQHSKREILFTYITKRLTKENKEKNIFLKLLIQIFVKIEKNV